MNPFDFVKNFTCPHCKSKCDRFDVDNNGYCQCRKSSYFLYSVSKVNRLTCHLTKDYYLTIYSPSEINMFGARDEWDFEISSYPSMNTIVELDFIPDYLDWDNIQNLIKQVEIMDTFQ